MKIINLIVIVLVCLIYIGCKDMNKNYTIKIKQMEELINNNLKPGDSEEKIIKFLKSQEWLYEYDEHAQRFQARNPKIKPINLIYGKKGHQIYIYVDNTKLFKKAEVVYVTAGL